MTLFLAPLSLELKAIKARWHAMGLPIHSRQIGEKCYWEAPSKNWHLAIGGHGKVQFGIQAQYWISQLEGIKRMVCLGAAGALDPKLAIGDLVCATKIIEHDYKETFDHAASLPVFHCPSRNYQTKEDQTFNLHHGKIASGDEDIVSPERAQQLFNQTQACAVAWEGAGGARVAEFNGVDYFEIRGITDNARSKVAESFKKNLKLSMENVAEFIFHNF